LKQKYNLLQKDVWCQEKTTKKRSLDQVFFLSTRLFRRKTQRRRGKLLRKVHRNWRLAKRY